MNTAGPKDQGIRPIPRNTIVGPIEEIHVVRIGNSQPTLGSSESFTDHGMHPNWIAPYTEQDNKDNRLFLVAKVPNPRGIERGDNHNVTIWDKGPKGFFDPARPGPLFDLEHS